jgi:putative DNA primase/helicase
MSDTTDIKAEVEQTAAELADQVKKTPADKEKPERPEITDEMLQRMFYANEVGDAELAVLLFRDRFVRDNATGIFYEFRDHRWHQCRNRETEAAIKEIAQEYSKAAARCAKAAKESDEDAAKQAGWWKKSFNQRAHAVSARTRMRNVLDIATAGDSSLGITGDHWNSNHQLLPAANGVIDLETGKIRTGRYNDWFFAGSPVEYKGYHHEGPFVPEFLRTLLCNDASLVEYMQNLLGFATTGVQTKDFFVAYGPLGWNGKSVLFDWVQRILGDFAATVPVELIYEDRFGRDPDKPSPQILRFRGLRLAIMTEPESNKRLSPAKVKQLTSGTDKLGGRNLNERELVSFWPTHTLIMHGNEVPRVQGHQGPFYDRLRMIPFRARFVRPDVPEDPERHIHHQIPREKMNRILQEHDQEFLSFLVRCARRALELGDMPNPPDPVLNETRAFRDEEDLVGRFLRQCTKEEPTAQEQAKDVYRSFCYWCREEVGLTARSTPSMKAISADLRAHPHIEKVEGRTVVYGGIKIHQEWVPPEDWK